MPEEPTSNFAEVASEILVLLGHDPRAASPPGTLSLDALRKCTREQLAEYARRLGLTGVAKLNKETLAGRVLHALGPQSRERGGQAPARDTRHADSNGGDAPGAESPVAADGADEPAENGGAAPFPGKFDLGPDSQEEPTPHNIPWGYGQNRVTAMVVDPERLFVYWECTDAAIDGARRGLGRRRAGRLAEPARLRHHRPAVRRHQRPQLLRSQDRALGPAVVLRDRQADVGGVRRDRAEVGRGILRQDRALGARRVPAPRARRRQPRRVADGEHGERQRRQATPGGGPGGGGGGGGEGGAFGGGTASQRGLHGLPEWVNGGAVAPAGGPGVGPHVFERRWEWRETVGGGVRESWTGERSQVEWIGPLIRSAWEAGPFTYPVQSPAYIEEWNEGTMTVRSDHGEVHVVYGPWQVVIRGVGAHAERRVLATWEIRRSWATTVGIERSETVWRQLGPGSSEWIAQGGSERAWAAPASCGSAAPASFT